MDKRQKLLIWTLVGMFLKHDLHDVKFNEENNKVEVLYGNGFYKDYQMSNKEELLKFKSEFFGTLDLEKEYKDKEEFYKLLTQSLFQDEEFI